MVQLDGSLISTKEINNHSTLNDRKEKNDQLSVGRARRYEMFLVRAKATKLLLTL